MRHFLAPLFVALFFIPLNTSSSCAFEDTLPNIVLVMADDQGWGQTGYRGHPVLKTPNIDEMAKNGLRFERFYAGAPNCSPTRATVLTGRNNDRCGTLNHGYALRLQEKTVAQVLKSKGYATGHFGKWHLNGQRGPGAPILKTDSHHPGRFGFDVWLSMSNFYDRDPIMSCMGEFEEFKGDSSEIAVNEALKFIEAQANNNKPSFTVIWYGTPHSPFRALNKDSKQFADLPNRHAQHYGELVAMDRSIGTLRKRLRELEIADNTIVWYCSDNGGLKPFGRETVGGLRGNKGGVYEGGLRVPCVVEWPAKIKSRVTHFPASTMDIFPTLVTLVGATDQVDDRPMDGGSLLKLFETEIEKRSQPIPFHHQGRGALIDNQYKIVTQKIEDGNFELYDLSSDPQEQKNLAEQRPEILNRMKHQFAMFHASVENSLAGKDYPEGKLSPADKTPIQWRQDPSLKPFFKQWSKRPEYRQYLKNANQ